MRTPHVDNAKIPLAEETAAVGKRTVVRSKIKVTTETNEIKTSVPINLVEDSVDIQRVRIDKAIDVVPEVRVENGVTIIPVVREVPVVTLQMTLVEEIHIRITSEHRHVEIPVTLREQTVAVERQTPKPERSK